MLHPLQFWDFQDAAHRALVKDLTVRGKLRTQFKRQYLGISLADCFIRGDLFSGRLAVQSRGLENNRSRSQYRDGVELLAVERDYLSFLVLDVSSCYEGDALPQSVTRPAKNVELFRFVQQIDVPGIHVDGIHKSCLLREQQMRLERIDVD